MNEYFVKGYECFFFVLSMQTVCFACVFKQFDSIARLSNIFQIIRSLVSMAQKLKLAMTCISFD
jgi:hypothetical protein